jgi:transposase
VNTAEARRSGRFWPVFLRFAHFEIGFCGLSRRGGGHVRSMTHEQVDDVPVLLAQLQRMGLPGLLDAHFPTHGNWQGLSLGWVVTVWLTHLLSQGDHCLAHVRPWAAQRLEILRHATGQPLQALDLTDDRLASVLNYLSDDARWQALEQALAQRLLRVYAPSSQQVRLDGTPAPSFRDVNPEGLFRKGYGHAGQPRPPLPQVKVFLATLDPLGLPLATLLFPGNQPDDPCYVPTITRVRRCLEQRGLLYVGDCKMGALATRAWLAAGGDQYLCPLSPPQLPAADLAQAVAVVWEAHEPLVPVYRSAASSPGHTVLSGPVDGDWLLAHLCSPAAADPAAADPAAADPAAADPAAADPSLPLAVAFERTVCLTAEVEGHPVTWQERRCFVCSLQQAQAELRKLQRRLTEAEAALAHLNPDAPHRRRYRTQAALEAAVAKILTRYDVADLLEVEYAATTGARAGRRPETLYRVQVRRHAAAWEQRLRLLGWRAYATNAPATLSVAQVVRVYRNQYLIERDFSRLKGRPLSLTPLYLQDEQRIVGLVRLLTLALRALCLLEDAVRQSLAALQESLTGLYPGQPGRRTDRPSAELLLAGFRGITLFLDETEPAAESPSGDRSPSLQPPRRVLSRFLPLHAHLLDLLHFPHTLYTALCVHPRDPPAK